MQIIGSAKTYIHSQRLKQNFKMAALIVALLLSTVPSHAQTLVNVNTSLGDFQIELFDSAAPATVANFLNYVTSGRYNGTIIHRSEPGFVVQGGFYTFSQSVQSFGGIITDPPVVNEFGISNTRGTLAMAKSANNPNSATSQWFINLSDSNAANLDNQNGGFTVFAEVVGDGMDVVDAIARLNRFAFQIGNTPVVNYTGGTLLNSNLVTLSMSVTEPEPEPEPEPANVFNEANNTLSVKVALEDGQFISLVFSVFATDPQIQFQASLDSVTALASGETDFAQFNGATGELLIPELFIGGEIALRNVLLLLEDADQLLFSLQSFNEL